MFPCSLINFRMHKLCNTKCIMKTENVVYFLQMQIKSNMWYVVCNGNLNAVSSWIVVIQMHWTLNITILPLLMQSNINLCIFRISEERHACKELSQEKGSDGLANLIHCSLFRYLFVHRFRLLLFPLQIIFIGASSCQLPFEEFAIHSFHFDLHFVGVSKRVVNFKAKHVFRSISELEHSVNVFIVTYHFRIQSWVQLMVFFENALEIH